MANYDNYDLQKIANMAIHRVDDLRLKMKVLFPDAEYADTNEYKEALHNLRLSIQKRLNEIITAKEKEIG